MSVDAIVSALEASDITAYRKDLLTAEEELNKNPKSLTAYNCLDSLCHSPRALKDLDANAISRKEWMDLILDLAKALREVESRR